MNTSIRFSLDRQPLTHSEAESLRTQAKGELATSQLIENLSLAFGATFLMFFLFVLLIFGNTQLCVELFYSDYEFSIPKVCFLTILVLAAFSAGFIFRCKKENLQRFTNRLNPVADKRRCNILQKMEGQFDEIREYCDKVRAGDRAKLVEGEWSLISHYYATNFASKNKDS